MVIKYYFKNRSRKVAKHINLTLCNWLLSQLFSHFSEWLLQCLLKYQKPPPPSSLLTDNLSSHFSEKIDAIKASFYKFPKCLPPTCPYILACLLLPTDRWIHRWQTEFSLLLTEVNHLLEDIWPSNCLLRSTATIYLSIQYHCYHNIHMPMLLYNILYPLRHLVI